MSSEYVLLPEGLVDMHFQRWTESVTGLAFHTSTRSHERTKKAIPTPLMRMTITANPISLASGRVVGSRGAVLGRSVAGLIMGLCASALTVVSMVRVPATRMA